MSAFIVLILRILLTIALYTFIAWALYTLWRDLKLQSMILAGRKIPTLTLRMEGHEGEVMRQFEKTEIFVGRSANSDFSVPDETVSATHARLTYHHNQWWVEDLRSTNGTFLNDERVYTQTVLIAGDELRVGKVVLLVSVG
jgi:hypothetical protein